MTTDIRGKKKTGELELGETPKQRAAKAARADYERLRQYCTDLWIYVGSTDDYADERFYGHNRNKED